MTALEPAHVCPVQLPSCRAAGTALVLGILFWSACAGTVMAQETGAACPEAYSEAESHYLNGRFGQAVELLRGCLDQEQPSGEGSVRIYRLLALAYLYDGEDGAARQAVHGLLERVPDYTPDPVQDPPSYASLVASVREERVAAEPEPPADERAPEPEQGETPQDEPQTDAPQPADEAPVAAPRDDDESPAEADETTPPSQEEPPPPFLPPDESLTGGEDAPSRPPLNGPKRWLMVTGGAAVVFTAVALALGG